MGNGEVLVGDSVGRLEQSRRVGWVLCSKKFEFYLVDSSFKNSTVFS